MVGGVGVDHHQLEGPLSDSSAAFSWTVAALGFWAAWLAVTVLPIPVLWYLPVEHRFVFGAQPPGMVMGLYGQLLVASLAGAGCGGCARLLSRGWQVRALEIRLALACAVPLLGVISYYALAMWGRVP